MPGARRDRGGLKMVTMVMLIWTAAQRWEFLTTTPTDSYVYCEFVKHEAAKQFKRKRGNTKIICLDGMGDDI
jgi:hypothetical protein